MSNHSQSRPCQNCKNPFTIEPEDFDFYQKIDVPPPTFCPECRLIRRMTWRNDRSLYKRTCKGTNKEIVSCFSSESGVAVYDHDYWWSDKWDPKEYGKEYDFSRSFFDQFQELLRSVPLLPLFNSRNVNSPYTNFAGELKNVYLSFGMWECENVMYSAKTASAKECVDVYWANGSQLCYELVNSHNCYNSKYLVDSTDIVEGFFLFDCHNCQNCFMSTGQRNKKYIFNNEQLSKEEYTERIKTIDFGSYTTIQELTTDFDKLKQNAIHKFSHNINTQNSTGDYLMNVNNCHSSFDLSEAQDSKYIVSVAQGLKDTYDVYGAGVNAELLYEAIDTGLNCQKLMFCLNCWGGHSVSYAISCHNSENIFGCIGIHKGKYCILNKQYTKEEYLKIIKKIKEQMDDVPYIDKMGRRYGYGEFFPTEISPFAFNETIAQDYFPVTESEAIMSGFKWYPVKKSSHSITKKIQDIPDNIRDVEESIISNVFECLDKDKEFSSGTFKITPQELEFYKRMNIPLPRKSPNARYYARLMDRTPMKLWERNCMCIQNDHSHNGPCLNKFETSYALNRPEVIYCESCYQKELI